MAGVIERATKILAELLPPDYDYEWFDRDPAKPIVALRAPVSVPTMPEGTRLSEYALAQLVKHCRTKCTLNTGLTWGAGGDTEGLVLKEMEVKTRVAVDEATPNWLQCAVDELQVSRERVSVALAEILATVK